MELNDELQQKLLKLADLAITYWAKEIERQNRQSLFYYPTTKRFPTGMFPVPGMPGAAGTSDSCGYPTSTGKLSSLICANCAYPKSAHPGEEEESLFGVPGSCACTNFVEFPEYATPGRVLSTDEKDILSNIPIPPPAEVAATLGCMSPPKFTDMAELLEGVQSLLTKYHDVIQHLGAEVDLGKYLVTIRVKE